MTDGEFAKGIKIGQIEESFAQKSKNVFHHIGT